MASRDGERVRGWFCLGGGGGGNFLFWCDMGCLCISPLFFILLLFFFSFGIILFYFIYLYVFLYVYIILFYLFSFFFNSSFPLFTVLLSFNSNGVEVRSVRDPAACNVKRLIANSIDLHCIRLDRPAAPALEARRSPANKATQIWSVTLDAIQRCGRRYRQG